MGELLRKLKVDGEEFERNNEDTFDLTDLLHPRRFRIPRMSSKGGFTEDAMTVFELFAVACGLSLLFLFASFWR